MGWWEVWVGGEGSVEECVWGVVGGVGRGEGSVEECVCGVVGGVGRGEGSVEECVCGGWWCGVCEVYNLWEEPRDEVRYTDKPTVNHEIHACI